MKQTFWLALEQCSAQLGAIWHMLRVESRCQAFPTCLNHEAWLAAAVCSSLLSSVYASNLGWMHWWWPSVESFHSISQTLGIFVLAWFWSWKRMSQCSTGQPRALKVRPSSAGITGEHTALLNRFYATKFLNTSSIAYFKKVTKESI